MTPTFWSLTKQQRRIHLDRSLKAGDIARPSRDPEVWLVSSDTLTRKHGYPVYWRVHVKHATCGCPGFLSKGCCRHVSRAIHDAWHARNTPANVTYLHAA